jgi:hypothetical protein
MWVLKPDMKGFENIIELGMEEVWWILKT